jgi:hypothetical protein
MIEGAQSGEVGQLEGSDIDWDFQCTKSVVRHTVGSEL